MFNFKRKKEVKDITFPQCVYLCKDGDLPLRSNKCPQWINFVQDFKNDNTQVIEKKEVGKCAFAWIAYLLCEISGKIGK